MVNHVGKMLQFEIAHVRVGQLDERGRWLHANAQGQKPLVIGPQHLDVVFKHLVVVVLGERYLVAS